MYLDDSLKLFDETATTGAAAFNGSIIDLGVGDLGAGENMFIVAVVDTTLSGNSVSTLQFILQDDTASNLGSAATHVTADFDAITAGSRVVLRVPPGCNRYVRGRLVADQSPTAGAVSAFITKDVDLWTPYANNYENAG